MSDVLDLGTRASVILDSISPRGIRLTTLEVTLHRFVLAELNTHRVFSRNSASSRAIPFSKQVARIAANPAIPVEWASEQKGMQGGEELAPMVQSLATTTWLAARNAAMKHASDLADLGVHKSIVNRLLEPFMWHTVIITSTEWDGFWDQRCSPLAQPEIRVAAEAMKEVYDASEPTPVGMGEWHLPYVDAQDRAVMSDIEVLKKVSTARCARVSYLTHDGERSIEKDLDLFWRLAKADPMHASPMEHVATPAADGRIPLGNFNGWRQFRHDIEYRRAAELAEASV